MEPIAATARMMGSTSVAKRPPGNESSRCRRRQTRESLELAGAPASLAEAAPGSLPLLEGIGAKLQSLMPDDPEDSIIKRLTDDGDGGTNN